MISPGFDPIDFAFRAGQELYKAGLISIINTRRQERGRAPVAWPQVGATPSELMWSEGSARLLRYRRGEGARRTPLLLVCSLINRPYVLDLLEERSVVRRLLDGGHDVWLLDWGTPTRADADRSLAGYALELLPRVAERVCATAGTDSLHLLGYCMGGTLSLLAIAADRIPAASLVAMATPVDLFDDGLLSTWCRTPGFDPVELAAVYGNVPPHVLQPAFKMLDPVALATKLVHLDGKVDDDDFVRFFLAMETWLEDSVAFPGRAFVDWIALYRSNALARNELTLDGVRIDLARLRCPIFNIVADGDYITPPRSSLALQQLAPRAELRLMRLAGGHIGLSTGRAAHQNLWPAVSDWLLLRDASAQKTPPRPNGANAQQNGADAQRNGADAQRNGAGAQRNGAAAQRTSAGASQYGAGAQRAGAVAPHDSAGAQRAGTGAPPDGAGARRTGAGAPQNGAGAQRAGAGAPPDGAGARQSGAGAQRRGATAQQKGAPSAAALTGAEFGDRTTNAPSAPTPRPAAQRQAAPAPRSRRKVKR
jgi:polyhydroxyalkanoate synthase